MLIDGWEWSGGSCHHRFRIRFQIRFGFGFEGVLDTHPTNVDAFIDMLMCSEHHEELRSNDCRKPAATAVPFPSVL